MEKLFSDSETMNNERPAKITEQQEKYFYQQMAEEIISNKWSNSNIEDIISDISDINEHHSGYEIAKDLESYGKRSSYEIDSCFIEFLEGFYFEKRRILNNNVAHWVKAHNPRPKFKLGQKLLVEKDLWMDMKKDIVIFVTGFDKLLAKYIIDIDPNKNGGTLIEYERLESNCSKVK